MNIRVLRKLAWMALPLMTLCVSCGEDDDTSWKDQIAAIDARVTANEGTISSLQTALGAGEYVIDVKRVGDEIVITTNKGAESKFQVAPQATDISVVPSIVDGELVIKTTCDGVECPLETVALPDVTFPEYTLVLEDGKYVFKKDGVAVGDAVVLPTITIPEADEYTLVFEEGSYVLKKNGVAVGDEIPEDVDIDASSIDVVTKTDGLYVVYTKADGKTTFEKKIDPTKLGIEFPVVTVETSEEYGEFVVSVTGQEDQTVTLNLPPAVEDTYSVVVDNGEYWTLEVKDKDGEKQSVKLPKSPISITGLEYIPTYVTELGVPVEAVYSPYVVYQQNVEETDPVDGKGKVDSRYQHIIGGVQTSKYRVNPVGEKFASETIAEMKKSADFGVVDLEVMTVAGTSEEKLMFDVIDLKQDDAGELLVSHKIEHHKPWEYGTDIKPVKDGDNRLYKYFWNAPYLYSNYGNQWSKNENGKIFSTVALHVNDPISGDAIYAEDCGITYVPFNSPDIVFVHELDDRSGTNYTPKEWDATGKSFGDGYSADIRIDRGGSITLDECFTGAAYPITYVDEGMLAFEDFMYSNRELANVETRKNEAQSIYIAANNQYLIALNSSASNLDKLQSVRDEAEREFNDALTAYDAAKDYRDEKWSEYVDRFDRETYYYDAKVLFTDPTLNIDNGDVDFRFRLPSADIESEKALAKANKEFLEYYDVSGLTTAGKISSIKNPSSEFNMLNLVVEMFDVSDKNADGTTLNEYLMSTESFTVITANKEEVAKPKEISYPEQLFEMPFLYDHDNDVKTKSLSDFLFPGDSYDADDMFDHEDIRMTSKVFQANYPSQNALFFLEYTVNDKKQKKQFNYRSRVDDPSGVFYTKVRVAEGFNGDLAHLNGIEMHQCLDSYNDQDATNNTPHAFEIRIPETTKNGSYNITAVYNSGMPSELVVNFPIVVSRDEAKKNFKRLEEMPGQFWHEGALSLKGALDYRGQLAIDAFDVDGTNAYFQFQNNVLNGFYINTFRGTYPKEAIRLDVQMERANGKYDNKSDADGLGVINAYADKEAMLGISDQALYGASLKDGKFDPTKFRAFFDVYSSTSRYPGLLVNDKQYDVRIAYIYKPTGETIAEPHLFPIQFRDPFGAIDAGEEGGYTITQDGVNHYRDLEGTVAIKDFTEQFNIISKIDKNMFAGDTKVWEYYSYDAKYTTNKGVTSGVLETDKTDFSKAFLMDDLSKTPYDNKIITFDLAEDSKKFETEGVCWFSDNTSSNITNIGSGAKTYFHYNPDKVDLSEDFKINVKVTINHRWSGVWGKATEIIPLTIVKK